MQLNKYELIHAIWYDIAIYNITENNTKQIISLTIKW